MIFHLIFIALALIDERSLELKLNNFYQHELVLAFCHGTIEAGVKNNLYQCDFILPY